MVRWELLCLPHRRFFAPEKKKKVFQENRKKCLTNDLGFGIIAELSREGLKNLPDNSKEYLVN